MLWSAVARGACAQEWKQRDKKKSWQEKWWYGSLSDIRENEFKLAAASYRPLNRTKADHRDPHILLRELQEIEVSISRDAEALARMLAETR